MSKPEALVQSSLDSSTGIATVTLSAPSSLNAMTVPMGEQFRTAVHELREDPALRALILTGSGRAFSAGGDLEFLLDRPNVNAAQNREEMLAFYSRFLCVRDVPVPTIAAINGPASGAGLCVAMACDMRVIASSAKVGFPFSALGLHPGMAATFFLPRLVGYETAFRLLTTGATITGHRAYELGLVGQLVQTDDLESEDEVNDKVMNAATLLAGTFTKHSTVAIRSIVQTLRQSLDEGLERGLGREADAQAHCYSTPEYRGALETVVEAIKSRKSKKGD